MQTIVIWIMALVWGIIGSVFHQWHESETNNKNVDEWIRAIFFGAVAGVLVVVIYPYLGTLGLAGVIVTALGAGYSADSFILNIIRKKINKMLRNGELTKIIEEIVKDILTKSH